MILLFEKSKVPADRFYSFIQQAHFDSKSSPVATLKQCLNYCLKTVGGSSSSEQNLSEVPLPFSENSDSKRDVTDGSLSSIRMKASPESLTVSGQDIEAMEFQSVEEIDENLDLNDGKNSESNNLNKMESESKMQSGSRTQSLNKMQSLDKIQNLNKMQSLNKIQSLNEMQSASKMQNEGRIHSETQIQSSETFPNEKPSETLDLEKQQEEQSVKKFKKSIKEKLPPSDAVLDIIDAIDGKNTEKVKDEKDIRSFLSEIGDLTQKLKAEVAEMKEKRQTQKDDQSLGHSCGDRQVDVPKAESSAEEEKSVKRKITDYFSYSDKDFL